MKRNNKSAIALIALSLLALSSGAAFAGHHWGNNDGMWQQGGSPLTTEQQATAQKIYDDYYTQTSALRQQLISKRYEYNALLTASSPVSGGDFDFFTGLRVAASALSTVVHFEGTETNQLYSIAFFQRLSNSSQSGFQSSFSLGFGQFCFVCNYINQLSLVHKLSLQCVYRLLSIECDGNARKALSCIHAPIATFFRLPNVDQTGGRREALWHDKSGVKSRFLVSLLKIYTDIALASLAQVCPEPFYQFNIAFFAVG